MKRYNLLFMCWGVFVCCIATGCLHPRSSVVRLSGEERSDKRFSDVFSDVSFISLSTGHEDSIGFIDGILHYKNRYLIRDISRQSIFGFDDTGKFIFRITTSIADFTVNTRKGTVEVYDLNGKLTGYDLSGKPLYTRELGYDLTELSCTAEGDYVLYCPNQSNKHAADSIGPGAFVIDSSGKYKYSILHLPETSDYVQPINCLSGYGDSILLVSNYSPAIYLVSKGKATVLWQLQFEGNEYDWARGMITSEGSGSHINIQYRQDINSGEGSAIYLDALSQEQLHFGRVTNDIFKLPIIMPYFYGDAGQMIGFLKPADLRLLKDQRFSQVAADDTKVKALLALSEKLPDGDNPVMIIFRLKPR